MQSIVDIVFKCHIFLSYCNKYIPIYEGKFMSGQKNLRMKAARATVGLSQSDLAEAVGVTRQTIGLIEAGGYNPTLNLCVAICKALHVTLNDLFWDDSASINQSLR